MSQPKLISPLTFEPIFMERIWGGRKLAELFGKNLPAGKRIGESWEIVDRPEAQSVVANGDLKGKTLHELWSQDRQSIFGDVPDTPRFPLLIKILDAQEKLSLQVHPPEKIAAQLGGEPKTECWYVAAAEENAELFVGFGKPTTREEFKRCLENGTVADCLHALPVKPGDVMFLPSGRFHAIGAGNVLIEVQQNSDTTYRVFDWNRVDESTGKPRPLHVDQALECIDFRDIVPKLGQPMGESLVRNELFEMQKWNLSGSREIAPIGQFAIVCCLSGAIACGDVDLKPGEFCLVPASLQDRQLHPRADGTTLLRVAIPRVTP
ncbi:MAG TPA: type I phosphomannose isomerase catalytic subunit [Chthoniobacterales bacterium]|jgi:mannose-6-phosphate isomerase|nr:type I phosphomannose isomerase catalytic subunit [Chthoniobacterales bacterium]